MPAEPEQLCSLKQPFHSWLMVHVGAGQQLLGGVHPTTPCSQTCTSLPWPLASQVEVRASSRRPRAQTGTDSAIGKIAAAHAQREAREKKKKKVGAAARAGHRKRATPPAAAIAAVAAAQTAGGAEAAATADLAACLAVRVSDSPHFSLLFSDSLSIPGPPAGGSRAAGEAGACARAQAGD